MAIGGATESIAIPEGCVVLNAELPDVHHLNEVVLDAPLPASFDARALVTLADRWLAGVRHRFVRVDDQAGAERLEPELVGASWERSRTVMMVRGAEPPPAPDARARSITESEHEAVMLANLSAKAHLLRETISSLESQLDPKKFVRIHRSSIVRIDRIHELQPWFHGEYRIILQDGTQLTLSRNHRDKLQEALGKLP